jgi:hypothetical protein
MLNRWTLSATCKSCKRELKLTGFIEDDRAETAKEIERGYMCDRCKTRRRKLSA